MFKKAFAVSLIFLFVFCGCSKGNVSDLVPQTEHTTLAGETLPQLQQNTTPLIQNEVLSFKGTWISVFEIKASDKSEDEYTEYLKGLFGNMKELEITDVFFHVRAFGDAVYESDLFPSSEYVCENQGDELPFDVLKTALNVAGEYGMNLHAWINPYRASSSSDVDALCDSNKAKVWIEQNNGNVALVGKRYYFNPASEEVRRLIIDGVREILEKYPAVKGIHIDDYFYPENCGNFDEKDYAGYLESGGGLSLSQWRCENVNSLVSGIYSAVKCFGSDKLFSVSPSGDIDKNRDELYADVEKWCSVDGYCDMIIPQIYFGFDNESLPFASSVDRWKALCESSDVKLVIGLALYKCGQYDQYAGETGQNEWMQNTDIMKRQAEYIKNKNIYGFSLYSSSYINFSESFLKNELEGLKSAY